MSSYNLPAPNAFITGHDESLKSVLLPPRNLSWDITDEAKMTFVVPYVNKNPADLNSDADITYADQTLSSRIGLATSGGVVLRYVDLAPGYTCMMHRTQTLEYGIALIEEPECVMDSGEVQRMKPGDVMIQRYTMHAWRNPSKTEGARIVFVLLDCKRLKLGEKVLKEDLGRGASFLVGSGNDK